MCLSLFSDHDSNAQYAIYAVIQKMAYYVRVSWAEVDDMACLSVDQGVGGKALMLKGQETELPMSDYMTHNTTLQATGIYGNPVGEGHSVSIYLVRCNDIDPASPSIHIANQYYLDAIYEFAHRDGNDQSQVEAELFYDKKGNPKPVVVRDVDCGSDVCLRRNLVQFYFAEYFF